MMSPMKQAKLIKIKHLSSLMYYFPALPVVKNAWGTGTGGELSIKKGVQLSLLCQTGNLTIADITWYKDDEPVPVQRYTSTKMISIKEVSSDDFGVYECKAKNSLGVTSRKIKVVNGERDLKNYYI